MKNIPVMILAVLLLIGLVACGQNTAQAQAAYEGANEIVLPGGWQRTESAEITEEERAVFDKAMEGLLGVNYVPVALEGTQVVAGRNYCFLCNSTVVYPGAETKQALVYIYEDLNGNASVTEIVPFEAQASVL